MDSQNNSMRINEVLPSLSITADSFGSVRGLDCGPPRAFYRDKYMRYFDEKSLLSVGAPSSHQISKDEATSDIAPRYVLALQLDLLP